MENGNDNSVITPPSKWLKTIFHCVIDPFASFKVRFSTRPKVFFFSDFNCLLTFTLQVKIYIWRALCRSYNWGSVMQSQPVPAISVSSLRCLLWPRHMYRQGQALTFYKNQTEKLNTTSYVNTHTHTHTAYSVSCAEFKSETQHSQADIYMYSVISEPAAGSIKSISHQARRSATFKYNYFVACNGRLHTNAEGWWGTKSDWKQKNKILQILKLKTRTRRLHATLAGNMLLVSNYGGSQVPKMN